MLWGRLVAQKAKCVAHRQWNELRKRHRQQKMKCVGKMRRRKLGRQ